ASRGYNQSGRCLTEMNLNLLPLLVPTAKMKKVNLFDYAWALQDAGALYTKQRISDTFSIPRKVAITELAPRENTVKVTWSDRHSSLYSYSWLGVHTHKKINRRPGGSPLRLRPFRFFKQGRDELPTVSYEEVMDGDFAVLEWLENIYQWGFCFVKGVPVDPHATEELLERISFIRNTHYGGFWDFTSDLTFKDTAYTSEFLGAHTDNTYFTDPARLQLFHLLSHTDGDGGTNLLVDGFQAASILNEENPGAAKALLSVKHPFHASGNDDVCIQPADHFPVFRNHGYLRELYQIRWNNYDRAPKRDWWVDEQQRWYDAARHFDQIIRRPEMEVWTQLQPGTALIFDNWRMLHGRSQFTGKRRMCGGYINNDDFISRYRLLKFGREAVLRHIGDTTRHFTNPSRFI
ncbi:hypothetical protein ARAM_002529, partial [Aspergillus rambellii]